MGSSFTRNNPCGPANPRSARPAKGHPSISLPVLPASKTKVRKSRTSKWRAGVLIAVHLIMIAHVAHWLITGRSVSPVEPSESMYTLNYGYLNAGFIFFAAAILATALLGRFVCGWGCHFVAYQDLCLWLLKKLRIHPKPMRSRLLVFAPLALALYMFVWPTVYRWWVGVDAPRLTNHLVTTDFWATFPGPIVAVLTVLVAGMTIVYFLGAKGFCTYACPYGGFFGLAEQVAPGRILVTDACEHCGHCTSVCTSNVRVHEEVAQFGMVVDPGCMKCMDCVSVCPNDALYFGFARPSVAARPRAEGRSRTFDFAWWEELIMLAVGLAALLTYRGLYDQIPLLMAMGMAAITAFVAIKTCHLIVAPNVRLQQLLLKRGTQWTRSGFVFLAAALGFGTLAVHSAAVQFQSWRGQSNFAAAQVGDDVWTPEYHWWQRASEEQRVRVDAAISAYSWADRWGLLPTYTVVKDLVWLHLARNEMDQAEQTVSRLITLRPREPDAYRGRGGVLRKQGRNDEAIVQYRTALKVNPEYLPARNELLALFLDTERGMDAAELVRSALHGRPDRVPWALDTADGLMKSSRFRDARIVLEELIRSSPGSARGHWLLGVTLFQLDDPSNGLQHLRAAVQYDPAMPEAQYDLGLGLLRLNDLAAAIPHLQQAVRLKPDFALAQYNLGVAVFMAGRPVEAAAYVQEALRLNPNDADAKAFLRMLQDSSRTDDRP